MKNLKSIVFFGTHELAVPALETLAGLDLVPKLIVTRPRAGLRGEDDGTGPHPVLVWAEEHGVEAVRSASAEEPELQERITQLTPDLLVVVDYGRPLPPDLLPAAAKGGLEIHPSLLPKLRGAHALRAAISGGENRTGVTAFIVDEEPWSGGILLQEELELTDYTTFPKLLPAAQELTCDLLRQALTKLDKGKSKPKTRAQNPKTATTTPPMGPRYHQAPWNLTSTAVYARLRALSPKGLLAYSKIRPVEILSGIPMDWVEAPSGEIGTCLGLRQGKLAVLCGEGTVFGIVKLRRPGELPRSASQFAREEGVQVGDRFS